MNHFTSPKKLIIIDIRFEFQTCLITLNGVVNMTTNFTILVESDFHKLDSKTIGNVLRGEIVHALKECTDDLEANYRFSDVVFTQVSKTHRMITSSVSNKGTFKTVSVNIDEENGIYVMSVLSDHDRYDRHFGDLASLVGNLGAEDARIIAVLNKAF